MDLIALPKLLSGQAALYAPCERGVLRMSGPDARAFLQRMSTNDMGKLSSKRAVFTCFLNNKGRLIDSVTIFENKPDDFLLVSSFLESNKLREWLENYHFAENFTIESSAQFIPSYALSQNELESPFIAMLGALASEVTIKAKLFLTLGTEPLKTTLSSSDWQMLRIACALPQAPNEINDHYMPQNVGLAHTISDTKGCYVGQEVIAKALTYQKNTKSLAAFRIAPEDFLKARVGLRLQDQANKSGLITSLSPAYIEGWPCGLAVVENRASPSEVSEENLLKAQFIF